MKKRTILDEIKNLNSHKPKTTFKEMFDSMEDEQNYFDEEDFLRAQAAAQQDIGSDFKDFGTTPAEKGLNFQDMIDDLKRQNLSLPNDEKELEKIKQSGVVNPNKYLAKKQSKQFGAGSINESKDSMFIGLQKLKGILNHPEVEYMDFGYGTKEKRVKDILEDGVLLKEGMPGLTHNNIFPYNYLMDQWGPIWYFAVKIKGNMGTEVVDFDFSDEEKAIIQHEETPEELAQQDFASIASDDEQELNEYEDDFEEGPQPGDAEFLKKTAEKIHRKNTSIERLLDAEGNPITLKCRVEDPTTGSAGRVVRFGVDDNNKQTVHVDWIQSFGKTIPKSIVYPETIVVRDDTRTFVKETEIEEGIGHSHTIGKGQNIKPGNYPQTLKRVGLKENHDNLWNESCKTWWDNLHPLDRVELGKKYFPEKSYYELTKKDISDIFCKTAEEKNGGKQISENLDLAQTTTEEKEVYLVVDNGFNRAHYKDLIGQTFDDAPGYAAVKVVKPSEIKENLIQEIDEYYIPEELRPFYISESIHTKDSTTTYEYTLKIKKQSDETPKDIINFIKEAENKKVDVILEYEKGSEKWVAKVLVN